MRFGISLFWLFISAILLWPTLFWLQSSNNDFLKIPSHFQSFSHYSWRDPRWLFWGSFWCQAFILESHLGQKIKIKTSKTLGLCLKMAETPKCRCILLVTHIAVSRLLQVNMAKRKRGRKRWGGFKYFWAKIICQVVRNYDIPC